MASREMRIFAGQDNRTDIRIIHREIERVVEFVGHAQTLRVPHMRACHHDPRNAIDGAFILNVFEVIRVHGSPHLPATVLPMKSHPVPLNFPSGTDRIET